MRVCELSLSGMQSATFQQYPMGKNGVKSKLVCGKMKHYVIQGAGFFAGQSGLTMAIQFPVSKKRFVALRENFRITFARR